MKQDRFLLGILVGIGALVVVALVVFFMRQETATYMPDDDPASIVHNYVLALHNGEYEKAYGYLADLPNKPEYEDFRTVFLSQWVDPSSSGIEIGPVKEEGDDAYVEIETIFAPSDPFSSGYSSTEMALLVNQNGNWKIKQMPYSFWYWEWYQEPAQEIKQP